jgi:hypothetical protein
MWKRKLVLCVMAFGLALGGRSQSTETRAQTKLVLESSDAQLVHAFDWARKQAMAYVFDGDPVGPWYEAALPGREAFCMRDVSHQCMGAQALGLARYNHNVLRRFAENISESRDWCSYWEINRYNRPAPVDYENDARFWYNLPANFDVLDACYRMLLWTGDESYVKDPVFLSFYRRTVSDYVTRWALDLGHVMKRSRLMNIRGEYDPHKKFYASRGIPSYEESRRNFVLGVDLLATQYAAYRACAYIEAVRGDPNEASAYLKKAAEVKRLINGTWWDEQGHHFYSFLDLDHHLGGEADSALLYRNAADDGPKAEAALRDLLNRIKEHPSSSVEGESHNPEILYRYGEPDVAYSQIMDLTRPGRAGQEYPEVSYSVVGAIVTGLMGINVESPSPSESSVDGNYVQVVVKTLPALSRQTAWVEIRNLPIRQNDVDVRHEGLQKTTLTNVRGPSFIWQATFPGRHDTLWVNGKLMKAQAGKEPLGRVTSWVRLPVGAGDTVKVEVPAKPQRK